MQYICSLGNDNRSFFWLLSTDNHFVIKKKIIDNIEDLNTSVGRLVAPHKGIAYNAWVSHPGLPFPGV